VRKRALRPSVTVPDGGEFVNASENIKGVDSPNMFRHHAYPEKATDQGQNLDRAVYGRIILQEQAEQKVGSETVVQHAQAVHQSVLAGPQQGKCQSPRQSPENHRLVDPS